MSEFIYVVRYPVFEDGCIQYHDVAFHSKDRAVEFAEVQGAAIHTVILVDREVADDTQADD